MAGKYRAYPEYRDSGVIGLDKIPAEWSIKKIKYLFNIGRGRVISQEELVDEGEFPVYSSQTANDGCLGYISTYDFDCEQITWTTDGANAGTVFLRKGKHNCTNVCGTLQSKSGNQHLRFFLYCLQYVTQFYKRPDTNGAKIMNGEMAEIIVAEPVDEDKTIIANFLDEETEKIDTLIEKQQQLIQLLKEKRQAVISHAVTKGLNPDVPMKDSGVEWLGEVPGHWEVVQLKYLVIESTSGPYGSSLTKSMYSSSGIRVYGQQQVIPDDFSIGDYYISEEKFESMRRYEVFPDDILISVMGTVGRVAVVPQDIERGIINPRLVKYKIDKKRLFPRFLQASILSDVSQSRLLFAAQGSTMDGLNMQILGDLPVALPSLEEQQKILEEISIQNGKFSLLLEKAQRAVELLSERRTALISAAVTGKIDVRLHASRPTGSA